MISEIICIYVSLGTLFPAIAQGQDTALLNASWADAIEFRLMKTDEMFVNMTTQIAVMIQQLHADTESIASMGKKLERVEEENRRLKIKLSGLPRAGIINPTGPSTAFYAKLSHGIDDPGEGQVIPFDDIVTNVGGYFNTHGTGVFQCGETGVYVFFWVVCTEADTRLFAQLMKNGIKVGETFTGRGHEWNVAVGVSVVQVQSGDDVLVQVHDPRYGVHLMGDITTFSGFKLA